MVDLDTDLAASGSAAAPDQAGAGDWGSEDEDDDDFGDFGDFAGAEAPAPAAQAEAVAPAATAPTMAPAAAPASEPQGESRASSMDVFVRMLQQGAPDAVPTDDSAHATNTAPSPAELLQQIATRLRQQDLPRPSPAERAAQARAAVLQAAGLQAAAAADGAANTMRDDASTGVSRSAEAARDAEPPAAPSSEGAACSPLAAQPGTDDAVASCSDVSVSANPANRDAAGADDTDAVHTEGVPTTYASEAQHVAEAQRQLSMQSDPFAAADAAATSPRGAPCA